MSTFGGLRASAQGALLFLALVGVTSACTEDAIAPLRLDVPVTIDDRAVLLAVARASSALELTALAIDADGTVPAVALSFPADERVELTALVYRTPLVELGLSPGPVTLLPKDAGSPSRALPTADATWTSALGTDRATWSMGQVSAALASARLPDVEACATFSELSWVLTTTHSATFIARATEHGVLVGDDAKDEFIQLFYVDRGGFVPVMAPLGRLGGRIPIYGGWRDGTGRLWLGSEIGGVWKGGLDPEGCDATTHACRAVNASEAGILTRSGDVFVISGPSTGTPSELFGLTEEGSLESFDGAQWSRVYDFFGQPECSFRSGVAWVGPGEAVAASEREARVVRQKDGATVLEDLPQPSPVGISAITHVAGYGSVAGDLAGHLYVDHGRGWTRLDAGDDAVIIRSIVPYGPGFMWSDEEGTVRQWIPGRGACPKIARTPGSTDQPHMLAVVGEDLALTGTRQASDGQLRVRWLVREE